METDASGQSPIFGNSSQNLRISRFQSFQVLSSFAWFFLLVDVYYSWKCIVNVSANIKTEILSIASKKGDYT